MVALTTTLLADGQVVLPEALLSALGWESGTRLTVVNTGRGVFLMPETAGVAPSRLEDDLAARAYTGTPKTIEQVVAELSADIRRRRSRGS